MKPEHVIVDVGSGTGISSEFLLKHGNQVIGVEPNAQMREAAEFLLKEYPNFQSVAGTSDATTLPDDCADLIVAAQAFHWFDHAKTKKEFARLLKPGGHIALIWNDRRTTGSPFNEALEQLILEYNTDYKEVTQNMYDGSIKNFLGRYEMKNFYNFQDLDEKSLLGRLASTSYMPNESDPKFGEMKKALGFLFKKHSVEGRVRIEYDTQIYHAHSQ